MYVKDLRSSASIDGSRQEVGQPRCSGSRHLRRENRSCVTAQRLRSPSRGSIVFQMVVFTSFESDPYWVTSLDGCTSLVRMPLVQKELEWFERTAF